MEREELIAQLPEDNTNVSALAEQDRKSVV